MRLYLKKNPELISYDYTLSAADAAAIRNAAKLIAYNDLSEWNVGEFDPVADFTFNEVDATVTFTNTSNFASTYFWDFGDEEFSTDLSPSHTYVNNGNYTATLIASECGVSDTVQFDINIQTISNEETLLTNAVHLFPNPTNDQVFIESAQTIQQVNVLDITGKTVSKNLPFLNGKIDLSGLQSGVYFIEMQMDSGELFVEKVVKE